MPVPDRAWALGTGTNFKPVPVPEIPDLPEIEAVLGYFMRGRKSGRRGKVGAEEKWAPRKVGAKIC